MKNKLLTLLDSIELVLNDEQKERLFTNARLTEGDYYALKSELEDSQDREVKTDLLVGYAASINSAIETLDFHFGYLKPINNDKFRLEQIAKQIESIKTDSQNIIDEGSK